MDVQKKLDEIVAVVEGARAMPMSASCVVNRSDLLALLDEVRSALPDSLAQAQSVLGDREQVVVEARREAERIIEAAQAERASLLSATEIARRSQEEADRILAEARREAEEVRAEADDYVDSKLANFEVVLTKTIGSVDRGREKLLGRGPGLDEHGTADEDAPERSSDPETLRRRADAYVDAKLGAFEAVLSKTLEAVGRGRLKLVGHREADDLAAHLAAQDSMALPGGAQSDAEYLAGLAGVPSEVPEAPVRPAPQQPGHAPAEAYPDPYAPAAQYGDGGYDHQQSGYGQDAYAQSGYGQEQPYAQDGYAQQPYTQDGYAQDSYGQAPYAQDPYGQPGDGRGAHGQGAYGQDGYGQDAYGQGAYGAGHGWQQQAQSPQPALPQQPSAAAPLPGGGLDETSFFDTAMIDLDRLRELDQGR
ncbi:ATP synthase F0 subunit B [Streptomyces sp. HB2AG]|uniref:ATP synthase F0 subunit B n=1 Tax=Streptomyces sp. HB2AG TaxID=2983400 RepID=UPI0022AADB0A|nr:cell division initiation protein [Streptomyces sp. HB2AG]MCZ2524420.1 cell division initiation protein [Streptomyces sp. HB2AG]